jgi:predicted Zn-dependent protease
MAVVLPGHLKSTFKQVRSLIVKEKNFPEARRILAGVPDGELYAPYHVAMAAIARSESDAAVAMAHLEKALSLTPEDIRLLSRIGKLRLQEGNKVLAQEYASRALLQKPTKKSDVTALASLLQQLGDADNAAKILREAVLQNPNDTKLRRMLAIAQLQLGQLDECERNLNNCLRLDPKNHYSQILLGEILIAQGNKVRGLAVLRSADNDECPSKLKERLSIDAAECYIDLGEYSAAKDELTRVQSSNSPRFNYCWGKIQYQDKDYEFALSSLMSASKSTGPDGDSTDAPIVDPSSLTKEDQQSRCEQLIHDLAGKLEKLKTTGYGSSQSGVNQSTIFDDNNDEF